MGGITMFLVLILLVAGLHGKTDANVPSNRKTALSGNAGDLPVQTADTNHWAVLVAGSKYFWNYRHQSDVCHAYQLLKARGFDDDHVITMVYDDIARNFWQSEPFYGKIFNRPGGPDVYKGCAKDYTGSDVTAENFYSVLSGDKEAMIGIGSERVVESTSADDIFVFYSDHGSTGLIGMPAGSYVWADRLNNVLATMADENKFNELVFYLESCEAGSMFEGILRDNIRVYALSAANATESSWATYCSDEDTWTTPRPSQIGTCMGDLFSTSWMEDSEQHNLAKETLHHQFIDVFLNTGKKKNHGYGSEVCQYGDISIDKESVSTFLTDKDDNEEEKGPMDMDEKMEHKFLSELGKKITHDDVLVKYSNFLPGGKKHVDQRDADMVFFMQRAATTNDLEEQDMMLNELRRTVLERRQVDMDIRVVVGGLLQMYNTEKHPSPNHLGSAVEMMVTDPMGRPGNGKPVVDDFDCLRGMMHHWEEQCGRVTDYSMKYARTFANLCNAGISVDDFAGSVANVCGARRKEARHHRFAKPMHSIKQSVVVS